MVRELSVLLGAVRQGGKGWRFEAGTGWFPKRSMGACLRHTSTHGAVAACVSDWIYFSASFVPFDRFSVGQCFDQLFVSPECVCVCVCVCGGGGGVCVCVCGVVVLVVVICVCVCSFVLWPPPPPSDTARMFDWAFSCKFKLCLLTRLRLPVRVVRRLLDSCLLFILVLGSLSFTHWRSCPGPGSPLPLCVCVCARARACVCVCVCVWCEKEGH